jgi:type I restriction enzyme M protein
MDPDDFRDYILGFIFYKYLSEEITSHANELLEEDGISYLSLDGSKKRGSVRKLNINNKLSYSAA